ncbi:hypothetical protein MRB53_016546 [Persea americana]|uniref:Uncharacterized protein n=1 Tax=Persea americana TaxID=3435 RepID=A0ACC2M279_PERAE|nr:hypothetical protein MRB53_016546 [Persea americana]
MESTGMSRQSSEDSSKRPDFDGGAGTFSKSSHRSKRRRGQRRSKRCVAQFARWDTQLFECRSRDEVECRTQVELDSVYQHLFDVPCEVQGSVVLCLAQQEVFLIEGVGSTCGFLDREAFSARTCGACLSTSRFSLCSSEMRLSRVCDDIRNKSRMCSHVAALPSSVIALHGAFSGNKS